MGRGKKNKRYCRCVSRLCSERVQKEVHRVYSQLQSTACSGLPLMHVYAYTRTHTHTCIHLRLYDTHTHALYCLALRFVVGTR